MEQKDYILDVDMYNRGREQDRIHRTRPIPSTGTRTVGGVIPGVMVNPLPSKPQLH